MRRSQEVIDEQLARALAAAIVRELRREDADTLPKVLGHTLTPGRRVRFERCETDKG